MLKYIFALVVSILTYFVTHEYDKKKLNQLERKHAIELDTTFLETYNRAYLTGFENGERNEKINSSIRRYNLAQNN